MVNGFIIIHHLLLIESWRLAVGRLMK